MASIHTQKIGTVDTLAAGATTHFTWNNPPWGTVLSYFAYPVPAHASGPHGSTSGSVAVTRVSCTWIRDNYNSDTKRVTIDILNTGASATGFELYESWID